MSNAKAVAHRDEESTALPMAQHAGPVTPAEMLSNAVASGASVEVVEKLLAMHERMEAAAARKAFDAAMSEAKSEIPTIFKNRLVDFTGKTGMRTNYRHEDLGEIARTVDPILAKHGLSYRFRTNQDGGAVSVTCIVSHRDGHSEENALSAARDDSGNKNSIQAIGSTITYLQRYTLKAALGLAASNDDDSRAAAAPQDNTPISAEQFAELQALFDELGTNVEVFCKYYQIDAVADLPASRFPSAKKALEDKRAKA